MQGGLAGMLLRLRADGHGELCGVGPPGLARQVHALRHFVAWSHPRVNLSECGDHYVRPVMYEVRLPQASSVCSAACV